jgi:hypothetical protein
MTWSVILIYFNNFIIVCIIFSLKDLIKLMSIISGTTCISEDEKG